MFIPPFWYLYYNMYMFNPCKSYTLNIAAVAGLWAFYYFAIDAYSAYKGYTGAGAYIGFIVIPFCTIFGGFTLLGLCLEFICKLFKLKFAFNFPVHKFKLFIVCLIYYPLFYLGLLTIIFHILLIIFAFIVVTFE